VPRRARAWLGKTAEKIGPNHAHAKGTLHDVLGGGLVLDLGGLLLLIVGELAASHLFVEEPLVPQPPPPPRGDEAGPRPRLCAAPEVDERCVEHELPPVSGPLVDRVRWAPSSREADTASDYKHQSTSI